MVQGLQIHQHGTGQGRLVSPDDKMKLDALDRTWLLNLLADAGYLVFRGFDSSIDQFSALVRSVCSRTMLDPAREFSEGKTVQKVDLGTDSVGLHIEHGTNPLAPHLTWFLCETAARAGSETTVCDGYRVWEALAPATQDRFSADIVYSRNIEEKTWRALVSYVLNGAKPDDEITVDDLVNLANLYGDAFDVHSNDDGSIYYVYRVPAAHPTLFGPRLAFANSILGPSYHYQKPKINFADGGEFDAELIAEIEEVSAKLTENIDWQDGDVAVVDNTRVMHGRRAILDAERRKIFVALGYVDQIPDRA